MGLNIKNAEVERLAAAVAEMAGETKTEAIRKALEERRQRLSLRVVGGDRRRRLQRFLESEIWPSVPVRQRGRRLTRKQEDEILGFGPAGL